MGLRLIILLLIFRVGFLITSNHWFTSAERKELREINTVCLDIDDTLSTKGKLTSSAYEALWSLKENEYFVVPITGRPAGWCDHIARFWPVDAVVGENGAFIFYMKNGVLKRLDTPMEFTREQAKDRLSKLGQEICTQFPQTKWASDQNYREYDLAIDICEDVPHWKDEDVQRLLDFCHSKGARAKLSSIHVNTWFGDYDKKRGFQHLLQNVEEIFANESPRGALTKESCIFIGDSPNDEPLFEFFSKSVAVANIQSYLDQISAKPRWLTQGKSGAGFVEMVKYLISQ